MKEDRFINFVQSKGIDEHQLSRLQLSEVIENVYKEILLLLKNELKFHGLDGIIKSGFVLTGGGSEIKSIEELVRDFFTRRVKKGSIQRSRISGLESVLIDYRYAGSIGLLLHDQDFTKPDLVSSNLNNSVIGKIKNTLTKGF